MSKAPSEVEARALEIFTPSLVVAGSLLGLTQRAGEQYATSSAKKAAKIVETIMKSPEASRHRAGNEAFYIDPTGYREAFENLVAVLNLTSVATLGAADFLRKGNVLMTIDRLGDTASSGGRVKFGLVRVEGIIQTKESKNVHLIRAGVADIIPSTQEILSTATKATLRFTPRSDTLAIQSTLRRSH